METVGVADDQLDAKASRRCEEQPGISTSRLGADKPIGKRGLRPPSSRCDLVGAPRFELGTSCPPDMRANQAAPRPVTSILDPAEPRCFMLLSAQKWPTSSAKPLVTRDKHSPPD